MKNQQKGKTSQDFYDNFATLHDLMLPIEQRLSTTNFFKKILEKSANKQEILDCACGTGIHIILFSRLGYKVDGMDLSKGMVAQAKKNTKKYHIKTKIVTGDFRKIDKSYTKKYDIVSCLGNSLPHLFEEKDIKKSLTQMYKALKLNGKIILSQRNYDKVLREEKRAELRQSGDYTFLYIYDYYKTKVVFNIIVGIKGNNDTSFKTFKTEYNPITTTKLESYLKKIGFKNIRFYNPEAKNFKFDQSKDDFFTVIAQK